MARDFLGTGWGYPVETDYRGDVELSGDAVGVEESIRIVLGTAKGERIMRPEFGCDIHDHVFATLTPATLNTMESDVEDALIRWEPRIDVENVEATRDENDPGTVLIHVDYRIRSTNSVQNMVYPFHVDEGEG